MRKLVLVGFGVLTVSGMFACGGVCERGEATNKSLATKAKDCTSSADGGTAFTLSAFPDKATCETNTKTCNAGDTILITAQFECLDKLQACEKGKEIAWLASVAACSATATQLSSGCTIIAKKTTEQ